MQSRTGSRTLWLCTVVLMAMALGTSVAQASTWMVNGSNLTSGEEAAVGSLPNAHLNVLGEISHTKVEALCTVGALDAWKFIKGGLTTRFRIILKSCNMKLNGIVTSSCEPNNEGKEPGVIRTKELEGVIAEHSTGEDFISIKPAEGSTLAVIEMSKLCAIGTKVPIIVTSLSLIDSSGKINTEEKSHTFREGPLTELWFISKTSEHVVKVDGEIKITLFSGLSWSVLFP